MSSCVPPRIQVPEASGVDFRARAVGTWRHDVSLMVTLNRADVDQATDGMALLRLAPPAYAA